MGHLERGAMLLAADQLDGVHQFLGIGIIKQEGEALNGLVRQAAAAGLFPRQVLVKKFDRVARARELFATHCAGRSAADDCYLGHGRVSLSASNSDPGRGNPPCVSLVTGPTVWGRQVRGKITRQKPARSIAPKSAAAPAEPVSSRTMSIPFLCATLNKAR